MDKGEYDAHIHDPAAIEKFDAILKLGRCKCALYESEIAMSALTGMR